MQFDIGDRVTLIEPTDDNKWGWNSTGEMDYYIGVSGVITEITTASFVNSGSLCSTPTYVVTFDRRYYEDGKEIRNKWYCKEEWVISCVNTVNEDELNSFFEDFESSSL